jgi:hypothetical protein
LDKEVAPRVVVHPGTRLTERIPTVEERSLAHAAHTVRTEQAYDNSEEQVSCFYFLEG